MSATELFETTQGSLDAFELSLIVINLFLLLFSHAIVPKLTPEKREGRFFQPASIFFFRSIS